MRTVARPHLTGWLLLGILAFLQSPGLTVADTKHDLAVDPGGFLASATAAWSDIFPLGQVQNQAYGYLFPQGLFFLVADPLPDWVAQRLWWTVVLGVGYSGFLRLVRGLDVGSPVFRILAAVLYALSPRVLTTLGAISSESWPVALAPWILAPLVAGRLTGSRIAASVLAVACLGAVNATATLAACVPAGIALAWCVLRRQPGAAQLGAVWFVGCVAVSVWWIIPLLVLGHYAPPFTDFIENAYVTTRWLNPTEILRGTTSWAPFVDTERLAGNLLVTSPVFILFTSCVTALGLVGLCQPLPRRGLWVGMLLVGLVILGAAHGPLGPEIRSFLDGPGAALRNIHKFDPVVRIPLIVGFAALGRVLVLPSTRAELLHPGRRHAAAVLVALVALGACAPALSGRLAPRGGWPEVPAYWRETADWLNANGRDTRTLILPSTSFARQGWGWTRDEPLQPLLDVPWVVRDAVPLVPAEAIRGLDGIDAVLASPAIDPAAALRAVRRLGVGLIVVRDDLPAAPAGDLVERLRDSGAAAHDFGPVTVFEIDPGLNMTTTTETPVRVAGGGESLALLDALTGPAARTLVDGDAEIVTDTPQLVARNYGTVRDAVSAPLVDLSEGSDVRNPVADYPSAGPLTRVAEQGGTVRASTSASDATSFGGADPGASVTAAVDGDPTTAWYPTPGRQAGEWIEITADHPVSDPVLRITATGTDVDVTVNAGDASVDTHLVADESTRVRVPGGPTGTVRVTLGASRDRVGIAQIALDGAPIRRTVTVPDTSPDARQFLLQRLTTGEDVLDRVFTAPRDMTLLLDSPDCRDPRPVDEDPNHGITLADQARERSIRIDGAFVSCGPVHLAAGEHHLRTRQDWALLTEEGFTGGITPVSVGRDLAAADTDRLLITGRAALDGLTATVGGTAVDVDVIDAATRSFHVPAGVSGAVELHFAGDTPYRAGLIGGAVAWLCAVVLCALAVIRSRGNFVPTLDTGHSTALLTLGGAVTLWLIGGWSGLVLGVATWAVVRYTLIPASVLAGGGVALAGMWLAHAPWPQGGYAGDASFVGLAALVSVAAVVSAVNSRPR
ncbi:alpha-(1-_3)-arabinofuranosyltransferase family protein [Corynebacterium sp. P5848]|uniref:alpha-(1->3)-arabinofuranosyltransferase domain-containing protein n=1 Tax=Corynebacterium marambiense TaxID=2765364 RepID=UPI0022608B15|nr:alpha-(1->3)-arabinofuranosyltransferase family protein [Corynebacterium marambiense]MCX7542949.1 alpha-(1->3)-arabinofuranosyltransferase family protein [Corynebacterium marambiense]